MVVSGTTANPSVLPSSFVSGDPVANSIAEAVAPLASATGVGLAIAANKVTSINRLNPANIRSGFTVGSNGVPVANANQQFHISGLIPADRMNHFVSNLPVRSQDPFFIAEYDFSGDVLDVLPPYDVSSFYTSGTLIPLSGKQSYVQFGWYTGNMNASSGLATKDAQGMAIFGTTASPAALPAGYLIPFAGYTEPIIRTASQLGCWLDIDAGSIGQGVYASISGVGTGRDDSAILNAFLAGASSTSPCYLFMDGVAAIGTSINLSAAGYTTIDGIGPDCSGFYILPGSNTDGIRIGTYVNNPANQGDSEGTRSNVVNRPAQSTVALNFRNFGMFGQGNSGNTSSFLTGANTPIAGAPSHLTYGILLANATKIHLHNVHIFDSPSFALCLSNTSKVRISDCTFENFDIFHDGIHLDGVWQDVVIANCLIASGDDGIAINTNEGYGGDSNRLTVTNCTFRNCLTWSRLGYGSNSQGQYVNGSIQNIAGLPSCKTSFVVFSNCVGQAKNQPFNFGLANLTNIDPNQLYDVTITGCSVGPAPGNQLQGIALINGNVGTVTFRDFVVNSPNTTVPLFTLNSFSCTDLFLSGIRLNRTAEGNSNPPLLAVTPYLPPAGYTTQTSSYGRITIEHCRVCDLPGSSFAPLPYLLSVSAPVAQLNVNVPDLLHVTTLIDPAFGWANVATARSVSYVDPRS